MRRTKRRRHFWVNTEVWELLDAMHYVNNGCPVQAAIKTLREGKLGHRTPGAIRAKMDRLEAALVSKTRRSR